MTKSALSPDKPYTGSAADFLPDHMNYKSLAEASQSCRGCELYLHATHTVFGDGPLHYPLMIVGEQPGNDEDLAGRPFVGPSGKLLQQALDQAGVAREDVYVTNAVKHFRFEQRGPRRVHVSPAAAHIKACRPWLTSEIQVIKPKAILCLGAVAAKSLLGNKFSITKDRGNFFASPEHDHIIATFHPSAALRAPDMETREKIFGDIANDLAKAATLI